MRAAAFAMAVGSTAFANHAPAHADSASDQAQLRNVMFDYATCVVRKQHNSARDAILSTIDNAEFSRRFTQLLDPDCLGVAAGVNVAMAFPRDSYRFILADALVNKDFAARGATSFADRLPLAQPTVVTTEKQAELLAKVKGNRQRKDMQDAFTRRNSTAWLARYGECVVRRDPAGARYWLLTRPDTPEEDSRIRAMQPAFVDCLPKGKMSFTRITLRGSVAVNYYRLAMATVVPASGSIH